MSIIKKVKWWIEWYIKYKVLFDWNRECLFYCSFKGYCWQKQLNEKFRKGT
jgi:hypothetical protein